MDIYIQKKIKTQTLRPSQKIIQNDHWLNVKCKTMKLLENIIGENLDDLRYGNEFLDITPKAWSMKEIIAKLDFIKIKTSALWKTMSREWEDKPQPGRKYLQKEQLIKDCYSKYTKNS